MVFKIDPNRPNGVELSLIPPPPPGDGASGAIARALGLRAPKALIRPSRAFFHVPVLAHASITAL